MGPGSSTFKLGNENLTKGLFREDMSRVWQTEGIAGP